MKLVIENLTKVYPNGVRALDQVNLEIQSGMFGLLGPNGAGKSSLMRTCATLQRPDEGSVFFKGKNIFRNEQELRMALGYLPQDFGVYKGISALKLLDYLAILKGITSRKDRAKVIEHVLHLTNLWDVRKKSVSGYSGGMRQRFGIAQLLLNNPKLIIVDEPTAGLDPAERNRFLNVLRDIGQNNIVIFSTHLVEDVKGLCTDMAIMNEGKVMIHENPRTVIERMNGLIWKKKTDLDGLEILKRSHHVLSKRFDENNEIEAKVYANEKPGNDFSAATPSLEDFYFLTLNHSLRNE